MTAVWSGAEDGPTGEAMRTGGRRCGQVQAPSTWRSIALDTLVDGVHFPSDTPAYDVGYKALAVNLSDLAAMGAVPTEAVAVVSIPEHIDPAWLAGFRAGLEALAGSVGVERLPPSTSCPAPCRRVSRCTGAARRERR